MLEEKLVEEKLSNGQRETRVIFDIGRIEWRWYQSTTIKGLMLKMLWNVFYDIFQVAYLNQWLYTDLNKFTGVSGLKAGYTNIKGSWKTLEWF